MRVFAAARQAHTHPGRFAVREPHLDDCRPSPRPESDADSARALRRPTVSDRLALGHLRFEGSGSRAIPGGTAGLHRRSWRSGEPGRPAPRRLDDGHAGRAISGQSSQPGADRRTHRHPRRQRAANQDSQAQPDELLPGPGCQRWWPDAASVHVSRLEDCAPRQHCVEDDIDPDTYSSVSCNGLAS